MKALYLLLATLSALSVLAQSDLYIVGTLHELSRHLKAKHLLQVLIEIKPDLILMELDSSLFDQSFRMKKDL
ncbi:hypothetical protein LAG90_13665 [Marinilongibacter aquaticus]|uniref:hypothetical protein n=1 Tax=Marinilongibacter aquaticus TaxID=2975157 RepID=UPI0021BD3A9F|nr:hypothetical protein [Marinilongibacter aquaticus]UBM57852.1 hypothetical protein LAG90_13665 [Marinilongibacter aquaticus]